MIPQGFWCPINGKRQKNQEYGIGSIPYSWKLNLKDRGLVELFFLVSHDGAIGLRIGHTSQHITRFDLVVI
jgi:hypothetical protein